MAVVTYMAWFRVSVTMVAIAMVAYWLWPWAYTCPGLGLLQGRLRHYRIRTYRAVCGVRMMTIGLGLELRLGSIRGRPILLPLPK